MKEKGFSRFVSTPSLYDILGVKKTADPAEIRRAYRRLAQKIHPDRNPGSPTAASEFVRLQKAYRVLGDPQLRAGYDKELEAPRPPPPPPAPSSRMAVPTRRGDDLHVTANVKLQELYEGAEVTATGWVGQVCRFCAEGCPRCGFAGQVLVKRKWTVQVPPGHRPSQLLRFSGVGHTGPFFDRPGDVYLSLRPKKSHGWSWSSKRQRVERTVRVPSWFLKKGGKLELRSPMGAWGTIEVFPSSAVSGWVRVRKLGLGGLPQPQDAWVRLRVGLWFSWGTRRVASE